MNRYVKKDIFIRAFCFRYYVWDDIKRKEGFAEVINIPGNPYIKIEKEDGVWFLIDPKRKLKKESIADGDYILVPDGRVCNNIYILDKDIFNLYYEEYNPCGES